MRGTEIMVSSNPKGTFLEGVIGDTSKPGTIMQIQAGVGLISGRQTWVAAAPGTDGKNVLVAVLLQDYLQGKLWSDAYIAGTRCFLYCPIAGEEMNVLCGEVAGTGNTFSIGDRFIIDAEDGILVPESGSPQDTIFICLERDVQVVGSTLVWCMYMG